MPEIECIFDDAVQFSKLMDAFAVMTKGLELAKRIGFSKHPLWLNVMAERHCPRDKKYMAAESIMYALDAESQFTSLENALKKRKKWTDKKKKKVEEWRKQFQVNERFSTNAVMKSAMASHLSTTMRAGTLYSMPAAAAPLPSLERWTLPVHKRPQQAGGAIVALERDVSDVVDGQYDEHSVVAVVDGHGPGSAAPEAATVFFRLVSATLGRKKHVPLPFASAGRLSEKDLCVTVHAATIVEGKPLVELEATRAASSVPHPVAVLSACHGNAELLEAGLQSWSSKRSVEYLMIGLDADTKQATCRVVSALVRSSAFPDADACYTIARGDTDTMRILERLSVLGLVQQRSSTEAASQWSLTDVGLTRLRVSHAVGAPQRVFSPLRDTSLPALENASHWQLFAALRDANWVLRQLPAKRGDRHLPPIRADSEGSDLVFYVSGLDMKHMKLSYLMSLVASRELFSKGVVLMIHHDQLKKYYEDVLAEKIDGNVDVHAAIPLADVADAAPLSALEMDLDDDATLLPLDPAPSPETDLDDDATLLPLDPAPSLGGYDDPSVDLFAGVDLGASASVDDLGDAFATPPASEHLTDDAFDDTWMFQPSTDEELEKVDPDALVDLLGGREGLDAPEGLMMDPAVVPDPSFDWGPDNAFRIHFTSADLKPPYGQWQATCYYHKLSDKTACTRTVSCLHAGGSDNARRLCMLWCLHAPAHSRRRFHKAVPVHSFEVLDECILQARCAELPPPPARELLKGDDQLDEEEVAGAGASGYFP